MQSINCALYDILGRKEEKNRNIHAFLFVGTKHKTDKTQNRFTSLPILERVDSDLPEATFLSLGTQSWCHAILQTLETTSTPVKSSEEEKKNPKGNTGRTQ